MVIREIFALELGVGSCINETCSGSVQFFAAQEVKEKLPMKVPIRSLFAVLMFVFLCCNASFAWSLKVPEIDPATGAGALAFISGFIVVIRGRGKKQD